MKNLMFVFSLLLVIVFTSHAQDKTQKTPEEKAEKITKKLTEKLSLTPDQAAKVHAISLVKAHKMEQAKAKAGSDNNKKSGEFKVIKQQWEADLKAILTAPQFDSFLKYKEERKAHHNVKKGRKTGIKGNNKTPHDDHHHDDVD